MRKKVKLIVAVSLWAVFCFLAAQTPASAQKLKNLAPSAKVSASGADIPVENVNDENLDTRWNAKNDQIPAWVLFTWTTPQRINKVHIIEFRSRITKHTVEIGPEPNFKEVKNLKMKPDPPSKAADNHPGNQPKGVVLPDHELTFDAVQIAQLRYQVLETVNATSEPSLWEIEIFYDPELDKSTSVQLEGKLTAIWANIKNRR